MKETQVKPKLEILKNALVVIFVAAAVMVVVFDHGHKRAGPRPQAAAHTRPKASPQKARPAKPAGPIPVLADLPAARIKAFLRAYYGLRPRDTAAVRRRRVQAFVSTGLLDRLSFGANRLKQVQVQPLTGQMTIRRLKAQPLTELVELPVRLFVIGPASPTEKYIQIETTSAWSYQAGRWTVQSFN